MPRATGGPASVFATAVSVQNLFGELSTACDFVGLVQNGFFTPPVVPHYRGRLGTVLHFAHYVSATYPSPKQVLMGP